MNPILVTGALAVAAASAGMLVSFSADHAQYSASVERASASQSDRLREHVEVERGPGGEVMVRNTGAVPVKILEVRTIDGDGRVSWSTPASVYIPAGGSAAAGTVP